MKWILNNLSSKFNFAMATGLLVLSLLFLIVIIALYKNQLQQEHEKASREINHLLQTVLENAMLKLDVAGLREIVDRLGSQEGIRKVMILNPKGEVRFASDKQDLGRRFDNYTDDLCAMNIEGSGTDAACFMVNAQGFDVLRSINSVQNRQACTQCHGSVADNPINGVLMVDSDARAIREQAWTTAFSLVGSGAVVVLFAVAGGWWFMRRFVLSPVGELMRVSRLLTEGNLDARVHLNGDDELAQLGHTFNHMAASVQQSMRRVREKEAFQQGIMDAIPDGIRVIDSDYTIVAANKTYCEQMKQGPHEIINSRCHVSSHNRDDPCPPSLMTCPLHEVSKWHRPVKTIHTHTRADGSVFEVEVYAASMQIKVDDDAREYIVESVRDLEKQIEFSLEQKLATLGQLATGIAHEIRNPLASVRLALQSSLRAMETGKSEDLGEVGGYLRCVDKEIDTCIDVTERLLRLSEPPSEQPQLVSVNEAIEDTLSLLAHEAARCGVTISKRLDRADVRVIGAASELRMIVFNLVQNAFHAMPNGGRLQVVCRTDGDRAQMIFQDTGVGVRPEDIQHIFEPFFSRRADGVKGTGLGLSICRSIVDRYGGRISLDKPTGSGARFVVELANADIGNLVDVVDTSEQTKERKGPEIELTW